jgi:hypothetical protein
VLQIPRRFQEKSRTNPLKQSVAALLTPFLLPYSMFKFICVALVLAVAQGAEDGLARTPPMVSLKRITLGLND